MSRESGRLRIGTSGYQYDHWSGIFYPENIRKREWFIYYAQHFDTVEINNTFYHLPKAKTFQRWHDQAPPGFCYTLKFSRYGSHLKKLKESKQSIGQFMERAAHLGRFLGPILVQLPPRWKANPSRLADFLAAAPSDQRWAVEFRDPSWLCDEIYEILRAYDAALCIHDLIEDHPRVLTADWVYLRYHGAGDGGEYTAAYLSRQAGAIQDYLSSGLDVFAYFNNDAEGYAVGNAGDLRRRVQRS